jgi:flagellin
MISLQTNVNSLIAQQNLSVNNAFQSKTIAQLTSGYRINQSGDDAAGLAVANKFRSTVAELTQGVANGNDATAQLQIMDGGMSNISAILDRLKTLATQSASGTFTGSRVTLNSEFQNDITEIDRQAQSIGLDTGGAFDKNLSVYLGQGSGSATLANAQVSVDLSAASVDAQSLGMKGMQAVTGTADLSASSATSVANVLANTANKTSEKQSGFTTLQFTGPGFDGTTAAISVNLNDVSDVNALVTSINSAIQSTGKSNAAFQSAGIVASVHTDSSNRQQLAFTSGTTAFQVQAGDQMANALMGNFSSGSTGASLQTKVIGQATTALGNPAGAAITGNVQLQISGGGLAAAQNITLTGGTTVADWITSLTTQIGPLASGGSAADIALQKAGISAAVDANTHQLVFTSSSNSPFEVQASGDLTNLLGLGTALTSTTATYTTITAGATYAAANAQTSVALAGQTTLEFSVNKGAPIALAPIALDGGDSTSATNASQAVTAAGMVIAGASGELFKFDVDGKTIFTPVAQTVNDGKAVVQGVVPPSGTAYTYTGGGATTTGGATAAAADATASFSLTFDGVQHNITFNETGVGTDAANIIAINAAIFTAFGNVQVVTVSGTSAELTFKATNNSPTSSFTLAENGKTTAGTDLHMTLGTYVGTGGNGGNNSMSIGLNGVQHTVTMTGADTTLTDLQNDLQAAINTAFTAGQITVGINAGGLTLTSTAAGADKSITIDNVLNTTTGLADNTVTKLGFTTGTIAPGAGYTAGQIAGFMNTAIQNAERQIDPTTLTAGVLYVPNTWTPGTVDAATVTVNNTNQILITNNLKGADHFISQVSQSVNQTTPVWSLSSLWNSGTPGSTVTAGQNRSLADLETAINLGIKNNAVLSAAGLVASGAGSLTISSNNGTSFQLNAGAAAAKATVVGTVDLSSGVDFSAAPVTVKLLIDGTTTKTVTLNQAAADAGAVAAALNLQLGASATASVVSVNGKNYLQIADATGNTGAKSTVQVLDGTGNAALGLTSKTYTGSNEVDLGFGVSHLSFVGNQGVAAAVSSLTGVSASGTAQTGGITFASMAASATSTQALTISASDSSGAVQSATITLAAVGAGTMALANDGTAASIDAAVKYINQQLQKTNNTALQAVVAVEQNVNGTPEINFLSSGKSFQVAVGTGVGVTGLNAGVAGGFAGATNGSGSTISIDSQAGAMAAVTGLASAVGKLGAAQAAIGRGENQLTYAISLAQSQITNFSAAESQIRDANVAQQAANLSKAQVLSQASIAAMAQANSAPQAVLSLLRG